MVFSVFHCTDRTAELFAEELMGHKMLRSSSDEEATKNWHADIAGTLKNERLREPSDDSFKVLTSSTKNRRMQPSYQAPGGLWEVSDRYVSVANHYNSVATENERRAQKRPGVINKIVEDIKNTRDGDAIRVAKQLFGNAEEVVRSVERQWQAFATEKMQELNRAYKKEVEQILIQLPPENAEEKVAELRQKHQQHVREMLAKIEGHRPEKMAEFRDAALQDPGTSVEIDMGSLGPIDPSSDPALVDRMPEFADVPPYLVRRVLQELPSELEPLQIAQNGAKVTKYEKQYVQRTMPDGKVYLYDKKSCFVDWILSPLYLVAHVINNFFRKILLPFLLFPFLLVGSCCALHIHEIAREEWKNLVPLKGIVALIAQLALDIVSFLSCGLLSRQATMLSGDIDRWVAHQGEVESLSYEVKVSNGNLCSYTPLFFLFGMYALPTLQPKFSLSNVSAEEVTEDRYYPGQSVFAHISEKQRQSFIRDMITGSIKSSTEEDGYTTITRGPGNQKLVYDYVEASVN